MQRTLLLSILTLALSVPAAAAEQEHSAKGLKEIRLTAINAEANIVYWNRDDIRIEVDEKKWPDSVYVQQAGSSLEISTGGRGSGVNVIVDECEGSDCAGKIKGGPRAIFIRKGGDDDDDDNGDPNVDINVDLEELMKGIDVDDKRVIIKEMGDDETIHVEEIEGDEGKTKVIIKKRIHAKDGEHARNHDREVEAFVFKSDGDDVWVHKGDGDARGKHVQVQVGVRKSHDNEVEKITIHMPKSLRLNAKTVNGELNVDKGGNGNARVSTVNGELNVEGFSGKLEASSVSGALDLRDVRGNLRARSVSGSVTLRDVAGEVRARSVSGDIDVRTAGLRELNARTTSGSIDHHGELSKEGEYDVHTTSGRVTFHLPSNSSFHYDIDTFSGHVAGADFAIPKNKGRIVGMVGKAKSDSPRITVKTLSGRIRFVKQ